MAASIKCDERAFKGGVWRGFASEVYTPPGLEPLGRFEPLGGFKQKQSEASKSKQWQAIESARI